MKKLVSYIVLFFCITTTYTREFRPPLYFLKDYNPDIFIQSHDDYKVHADFYAYAFRRKADKAFADKKINGSKKTSLATLFFNAPSFSLTESFANATFDPATPEGRLNPFVNTTVTPQFSYKDRGVIIGTEITKNINQCWQIGIDIHIPFRAFDMKNKPTEANTDVWGGQTNKNVFIFTTDEVAGVKVPSFAFRLDALAQLPLICTPKGLEHPLVEFNNNRFMANPEFPVTIRGKDITENQAIALNQHPATVLKSTTIPSQPFAITCTQAGNLDALSGDGISVNGNPLQNGDRAQFVITNNYTPLGNDTAAQQCLWVVPSVVDPPNVRLVYNAIGIRNVVNELLGCINKSTQETLAACNIFIDDQKHRGIGDLDTHFFARYFLNDCWCMQTTIGLRLPTGKKVDGNKLLEQPLGNNGHVELHLKYGMDAAVYGILPASFGYATVHADVEYAYVTPRTENIPASFTGATIKNLGPTTKAETSWHYIIAQFAKHWHPVSNDCHDIAIGWNYQLYHKTTDHISFKNSHINSCIGVQQEVSKHVAQNNTAQTAHTLGFDAHYYYYVQNYCSWIDGVQFFGGAHWVVGGKNIPRERGWHICFEVIL